MPWKIIKRVAYCPLKLLNVDWSGKLVIIWQFTQHWDFRKLVLLLLRIHHILFRLLG
jgi:hypothetical protein